MQDLQRPPWVTNRPLAGGRRRKGGAIRGPLGRARSGGQSPGRPLYSPSMSYPPTVQRAAARKVGSNSPAPWCRGALPPMKRVQRWGPAARREGAKPRPSPGDAPSWEDSARRPDSASALRVGVGLARPGWLLQRVRTVQGWVVDAADGPQSPLVASLLPLAVRAGALAFAGLAGIRNRTRRRCTRTTRTREGAAASGLRNGNAPRHGACPTLGVTSR